MLLNRFPCLIQEKWIIVSVHAFVLLILLCRSPIFYFWIRQKSRWSFPLNAYRTNLGREWVNVLVWIFSSVMTRWNQRKTNWSLKATIVLDKIIVFIYDRRIDSGAADIASKCLIDYVMVLWWPYSLIYYVTFGKKRVKCLSWILSSNIRKYSAS